jgi:hypothetical protein
VKPPVADGDAYDPQPTGVPSATGNCWLASAMIGSLVSIGAKTR